MKGPKTDFLQICFSFLFGVVLWLGLVVPAWTASWDAREVIHNYLSAHYPWAEVEILEISGNEDLPNNPPTRIHLISGPLGRAVFSFGFKSDRKAIIQAHIRALDWVATSRRPLKNGHTIQKEDIYLSLIDVRRMPKDVLTRLEGAWGKTVTRSIEGNMPIVESALGDHPIIKKGQLITLIASAPGLKITTQGEARENGHLGQQIKVFNLSSKQDLRGIPIDQQNVKVVF
ncbi:MAG: flagella basal body P-ring formation protein FlgA [Desulfobacca sp.]|nr:flagella basal body P-ring formation protein FlgA [Desulfobacca sp.]